MEKNTPSSKKNKTSNTMPSNNTNIVAAIVLGSSRITGLVGTKEIDGSIRVKAHVAQPSSDFIGKGRVLNVEKMTTCLSGIKSQLEEQASCRIKQYYVAIGCLGLRSVTHEVSMQFPSVETITDNLLTTIAVKNKEGMPTGRDILEALPLEYRLGSAGTQITLEPKGMQTDYLQANFLNIICNTNTIATLYSCFRRANIELAGGRLHIAAEHLASVLTTEQERTAGCVLVDIGCETTTVAIYKRNLLRHLVVIPLGSNSITRDIETVFHVEREEAEHLKRTHGYPTIDEDEDKTIINLRDGGRTKKLSELNGIIDARVEEIVQNIKHQIELSQLSQETLVNGIYICGGGAQMKNIQSAFTNHFKEWMVRLVKTPSHLSVSSAVRNFNTDGTFNTAIALVFNGDVNCFGGEYGGIFGESQIAEVPEVEEVPETPAASGAEVGETPATPESEVPELTSNPEPDVKSGGKKPGRLKELFGMVGTALKNIVKEDED